MPNLLLLILFLFFLLITSLVILFGVKKDFPVKYFSFAFLVLSLYFLSHLLLLEYRWMYHYPHLIRTISPLMFLPSPLFYLGLKQLAKKDFTFKKNDFIHFTPSILHFLELIPFYLKDTEEKRRIAELMLAEEFGWMSYAHGLLPSLVVDFVRFLLMAGYLYFSLKLIFSNKIQLKGVSRNPLDNWLLPTISVLFFIQIIFLIQYFFNISQQFFQVNFEWLRRISVGLVLLGIFLYLGFILSRIRINLKPGDHEQLSTRPKNSTESLEFGNPKFLISPVKTKYSKEELELLKTKLDKFFEEENLYLNPDLMGKDFASLLNVAPRNLPEIFTELYGKSYKDVVNSYRVNFAKSKIEEDYLSSCTVDSLAEISGFNSRITLYKVFKKEFSLSPTEYWDQIQRKPGATFLNENL